MHLHTSMSRIESLIATKKIGRVPLPTAIFWLLILIAVAVTITISPIAWDVDVYRNAIRSMQRGHDPYLDAITTRIAYNTQTVHPVGDPPFNYIYSPITLPLLRFIGARPIWLSGTFYWSIYIVAVLASIWVATLALEVDEQSVFFCIAPVIVFFPGLLANGTVLGGNIAYILYGFVLTAAAYGWKRNRWLYFYLAVISASCIKMPLLSLVTIPILSARKQWLPAAVTSGCGLGLFALTSVIWPELFKHYLEAINDQFLFNRDFGCSPAGFLSTALDFYGVPYSPAAIIFYIVYAVPIFTLLVILSRRYLNGLFSLNQWMPVLLAGVILLNPRIIEYDLAPITLFMLILAWRFTSRFLKPFHAIMTLATIFIIANSIASYSWTIWKFTEGPVLIACFGVGCLTLERPQLDPAQTRPS